MQGDLEKLRIDKTHKARHEGGSAWRWVLLLLVLIGAGVGFTFWKNASAATPAHTIRVRVSEAGAAQGPVVALNATGYIIAAHKIEQFERSHAEARCLLHQDIDFPRTGDPLRDNA